MPDETPSRDLARLGPYLIERPLGEGAMGVVYLARDERLGRRVAIKSLPEEFAADAERLARFEREARMLAALHHPHVASLFGLEELADRAYLVMEYVEGETLAERLRRGPLDLEEATRLAEQVARGLAAAHDKGIVHRDLKPGNVMVTAGGHAKVVDFGLAKDLGETPSPGATAPGSEPLPGRTVVLESSTTGGTDTATAAADSADPIATAAGTVLGTAAYMSPEQARGRAVDRRTDVWAFGCVVFEMLTGERPFRGKDLMATLVAVLQEDPAWELLPAHVPPALRRLLRRCLQKDPDERLRDLGDASLELRDLRSGALAAAPAPARRRLPLLAAVALATVALVALAVLAFARRDATPRTIRFTLATPTLEWGGIFDRNVAVAPDGGSWVYLDTAGDVPRLVLRSLDRDRPTPIPGTEGAANPFFSPDGRSLGFTRNRAIHRLVPFEGRARTLVELSAGSFLGPPSWREDGTILYASLPGTISVVPEDGGEPRILLRADSIAGHTILGSPEHVAGTDAFLVWGAGFEDQEPALYLVSGEGRVAAVDGVRSSARFVPPDRLLFARDQSLLGQTLDLDTAGLRGEPVVLAEAIAQDERTGTTGFAASRDLLISIFHEHRVALHWFDVATGARGAGVGAAGDIQRARISPDGDRLVLSRAAFPGGSKDIWIHDLDRGVDSRLTHTSAGEFTPVWSPDGLEVAYSSDRAGAPDVRVRTSEAGGEEQILARDERVLFPQDWSPDGASILVESFVGRDLFLLGVDGSPPRPWLVSPSEQQGGRFSPVGRWIAFASSELGPREVFVAPTADSARRRRVSTSGGSGPVWSPRGDRLYYHDRHTISAVDVDPDTAEVRGVPFEVVRVEPPDVVASFDVSPDGSRLLVALVDEELQSPTTAVQVGWQAPLAR